MINYFFHNTNLTPYFAYCYIICVTSVRIKNDKSKVIYINFEDDRLFPLRLNDLNTLIEAYYELYPDNREKKVFFLFDEVQVVENWELFIRRTHDSVNCLVYISGSSSKLLSREISTSLRGRSISFEVFPFSFQEYLMIKKIKPNIYSSKSLSKIKNYFNSFLEFGSMPEIINMDNQQRSKTIKEYLDLIIYKDLVERYRVSNLFLMKYLIKFLFVNNSSLVSYNKIFNDFRSLGLSISKNSIFEYISYLEDSYALFFSNIYNRVSAK